MRNADAAWKETKKQLRKDPRWENCEGIEREEREKIFNEHIEQLQRKNREMFHKLLEETSAVFIFFILKNFLKSFFKICTGWFVVNLERN